MVLELSHLVVNGCSFTYCQGLENPHLDGWPALLAKKLNVPVVNLATRGSGNDGIYRRTNEYFYKNLTSNSKPFYITAWSYATRREEFYADYNGKIINDYLEISLDPITELDKLIITNYNQEGIEAAEDRKLLIWSSLINLFKAYNIENLMTDYMPTFDKDIIEKSIKKNKNLADYVYNNRNKLVNFSDLTDHMEKLPCGHDTFEGQHVIADYCYQEILKRYDKVVSLKVLNDKPVDYLTLNEFPVEYKSETNEIGRGRHINNPWRYV